MNPGVGKDIAFVGAVRLAPESFGSLDKVVEPSFAGGQVGAFDLADTKWYPVDDDVLHAIVP